jgi:hypothetical protein
LFPFVVIFTSLWVWPFCIAKSLYKYFNKIITC